MRRAVLGFITLYKILLSPIVGGQCRFYPSCSNYAAGAFNKHSFWLAAKLSIKRLLRCNQWSHGGVDLVP